MQDTVHLTGAQHVVIDIDGDVANFALAVPRGSLITATVRKYKTKEFPTATDCIMAYAREMDVRLNSMNCAVAVSGAISGDSIRIARCPWILSAKGLGYLFQGPVYFLNDSAAMLWGSTIVGSQTHKTLGSFNTPDFTKAGKWLAINWNTGLGAALLISDSSGMMLHVESEAGHCAFSPLGHVEETLNANLAKMKTPVSWERALFADQHSPAWNDTPVLGSLPALQKHQAEMLGSFVGDTILATGAWSGVFMVGASAALLNNAENLTLFSKRLEERCNFQLQLRNVPRWSVLMPNMNLVGAARYLDQQMAHLKISN
jgi:glucokinase